MLCGRLAFELERKVELLAKKVQSKSHECEDLRRANEKLRSELYRSTKQVGTPIRLPDALNTAGLTVCLRSNADMSVNAGGLLLWPGSS